jgi:hypothetical protein
MLQIMLVCTRTNRFARRVSCENSCQPSLAFRPVRASSNRLRQRARCTSCGGKGARIQHPGWAGTLTQGHARINRKRGSKSRVYATGQLGDVRRDPSRLVTCVSNFAADLRPTPGRRVADDKADCSSACTDSRNTLYSAIQRHRFGARSRLLHNKTR